MNELTTLELMLTAVAVEISAEDPSAERMKVARDNENNQVNQLFPR